MHIAATKIVKLCSRHRLLEFRRGDYFSKERVRVQQHAVIKKDVVDANDFFSAQSDVRSLRVTLVHGKTDSEMGIVVKIRAGGNYPINEAGFDQRYERGNPETGRRQSAGQ